MLLDGEGSGPFGRSPELTIYDDALEVRSPGRLPNTATVESLRAGFRYARNQTLVTSCGTSATSSFAGWAFEASDPRMLAPNGTESELVESEHAFTVRLLARGPGDDRDTGQATPS